MGPSSNRNSRLYLERRDENSNPGAVGANQKMVNVNLQHVDDVEDAAAATPQASSELRRLPFAVESGELAAMCTLVAVRYCTYTEYEEVVHTCNSLPMLGSSVL